MKAGLVGLSLSGKTSLFGALTGMDEMTASAHAGQSALATVKLPDERLTWLAGLYKPKKLTAIGIEWTDLPGIEISEQASRNTAALTTLRQVDLLVCVLRGFADSNIPHPSGEVDPRRDWNVLRSEFLLADLDSVIRRIEKLKKTVDKPTPTQEQDKRELTLLTRCHEALEAERALREVIRTPEEQRIVRGFGFLSEKPALSVINIGEEESPAEAVEKYRDVGEAVFAVSAHLEWELSLLSEEERPDFMAEMGIDELAGPRLLKAAHDLLGRITFFTVSEKEVSAWSIPTGTQAVDCAGEIHTDMARGFIRAEVVAFDTLREAGSMKQAKEKNLVRLEGKHYEVADGDVIFFRFHV